MVRTSILTALAILLVSHTAKALTVQDSLAMLESGAEHPATCAADRMRGASGEVSRYQILPSVWQQYSKSRDYTNPEVAWSVAQHILSDRRASFQQTTGREPNTLELYLLWNKPEHFRATGFVAGKVNRTYRLRAQRFANLCTAGGLVISRG